MAKIGRNAPCPCGSGNKYKQCCGSHGMSSAKPCGGSRRPPAEILLQMRRHEAKEHRRRLMQGLGRQITSWEDSHHRLVAVGDEVHWGKSWRTFTDFLLRLQTAR